jgi:hypothetical protein
VSVKLAPEIEDELLALHEKRRRLSIKFLCSEHEISRGEYRAAIRRARDRRTAVLAAAQPSEYGISALS